MKYLEYPLFFFPLPPPLESCLLSANQRQDLLNRANIPRIFWAKLFGPRTYLRRSSMNTPNYICEANVCPIKSQLYSPNIPNCVRKQMFTQLRTGLTEQRKWKVFRCFTGKKIPKLIPNRTNFPHLKVDSSDWLILCNSEFVYVLK